jgi:hypothetical protein
VWGEEKAMSEMIVEHRVVAVETKLDAVIKAVGDLTAHIKEIAAKPQSIAWREIAVTAAAFLGLFAYVSSYLEGQYNKNIAVEKSRLELTEKALCTINPSFCILLKR